MRNITQYPMTLPEAIEILNKLSVDLLKQQLIGDIRPYALQWTIAQLGKLQEIEQKED